MARLRGELEIVGAQRARDLPARRAMEWLDGRAGTWQKTDLLEEKADVIRAVYERIVIEGAALRRPAPRADGPRARTGAGAAKGCCGAPRQVTDTRSHPATCPSRAGTSGSPRRPGISHDRRGPALPPLARGDAAADGCSRRHVAAGGSVADAAEPVGIRPSTVKRHLADLRARSGLTTEQLIYTGRAAGWLVVPNLEPPSQP